MASVEVMRSVLNELGEVKTLPIFTTPKYPETPPPTFIAGTRDEAIKTKLMRNGSPESFDVFQLDDSITKDHPYAEKIGEEYYIHVGVVTPHEPFILQHARINDSIATLSAEVILFQE